VPAGPVVAPPLDHRGGGKPKASVWPSVAEVDRRSSREDPTGMAALPYGDSPADPKVYGFAWALGVQLPLGGLLGLVWAYLSPRPPGIWADSLWIAESDLGYGAAADAWFGVLGAGAGLLVGMVLLALANRDQPFRRLFWWLVGALLGSGLMWLTGLVATDSLGTGPLEAGQSVAAVPLGVTSHGVLLAWPAVAMATCFLVGAVRALFSRPSPTEVRRHGPRNQPT